MLDNYHSVQFDRKKALVQPYTNFTFSPYGYSIQIAVESQFLPKKYEYEFGR